MGHETVTHIFLILTQRIWWHLVVKNATLRHKIDVDIIVSSTCLYMLNGDYLGLFVNAQLP